MNTVEFVTKYIESNEYMDATDDDAKWMLTQAAKLDDGSLTKEQFEASYKKIDSMDMTQREEWTYILFEMLKRGTLSDGSVKIYQF
jgi:hypothetical protein